MVKEYDSKIIATLIDEIVALETNPYRIARLLRHSGSYPVLKTYGWLIRSQEYPDGIARPYHLYVPSSYHPSTPVSVLIHMHGAVSRTEVQTEVAMKGYRDWWKREADEYGFLTVFPLGQKGAEWWSPNGSLGVIRIIEDLKRQFNIDENGIFATGFSDGGVSAVLNAFSAN